jgi:hypothetical protein
MSGLKISVSLCSTTNKIRGGDDLLQSSCSDEADSHYQRRPFTVEKIFSPANNQPSSNSPLIEHRVDFLSIPRSLIHKFSFQRSSSSSSFSFKMNDESIWSSSLVTLILCRFYNQPSSNSHCYDRRVSRVSTPQWTRNEIYSHRSSPSSSLFRDEQSTNSIFSRFHDQRSSHALFCRFYDEQTSSCPFVDRLFVFSRFHNPPSTKFLFRNLRCDRLSIESSRMIERTLRRSSNSSSLGSMINSQQPLYLRSSHWFCLCSTTNYRRTLFRHRQLSSIVDKIFSSLLDEEYQDVPFIRRCMNVSRFPNEQSTNSLFIHHGNDPF